MDHLVFLVITELKLRNRVTLIKLTIYDKIKYSENEKKLNFLWISGESV